MKERCVCKRAPGCSIFFAALSDHEAVYKSVFLPPAFWPPFAIAIALGEVWGRGRRLHASTTHYNVMYINPNNVIIKKAAEPQNT